jgi:hypothetical protein
MKGTLLALGVLVLAMGWYLFRPERIFVNATVNESFPAAVSADAGEPVLLTSGNFHGVAHEGMGRAAIYRMADGSRTLRFTDFQTSNGPDVQVYLVAAPDATDNDTVTKAGFFHVAALKGNVGDQNYTIPADVDLDKYQAVTIWCRRFGVNFATAPLRMDGPSASKASMPTELVSGSFHGVAHETKGSATIYQLPEGKRLLRLTSFETSNGPDVQVYLVAAPDATDNDTVTKAGFFHVAALKGNIGDQNYEIPADVDLNKYQAVTIWCRRFGVNFGTAPLSSVRN